jgi:flagellar biosynthetic protein FlhB
MPGDEGQEKTEQATPKRREEAREKGDVAKSREISSVAVLLASLLFFYFGSTYLVFQLKVFMKGMLSQAGTYGLEKWQDLYVLLLLSIKGLGLILGPFILLVMIAGIGANLLQTGIVITTKQLSLDLSRLNPLKGLSRLFSKNSLNELFKSVLKIIIVGYIGFRVVRGEIDHVPPLIEQDPTEILAYIGHISFKILLHTSWVLIFLAGLDYAFQKWQFEQKLKMTKQEVKDEYKQREGDPMIKARIRSIQRDLAKRRMMEAVPKADVVITNPSHLAIALEYRRDKMDAPKVVAKGAGIIAGQIKRIAREKGVPMIEDKLLAQALYKMVQIGEFIPEALYRAVAEILAYVYQLKGRLV